MSEPVNMSKVIPISPEAVAEKSGGDPLLVTLRRSDLVALIRSEQASSVDARLGPDKLIDITKAAEILSVSEDYIYHNLKTLPFVRKLGPKMLRFSFNGIQKWIASKV
jgi:predicted DNA-binding transcriptional regulator AlpA